MPVFSLPSKYGIGTLGKSAYKFIDFLSEAKQDLWQVLPSNPTSYGDSPYQSFSIYAQNPYFIDLELLVKDKLITKEDLKNAHLENDSNYIDYGNIFNNKMALLRKASKNRDLFKSQFDYFKQTNKWVYDYALFMVLKQHHDYKAWNQWEDKYKYKDEKALKEFYNEHKEDIISYMFMQFLYAKQWKDVLKYAHSKNVSIVGDMPIYVAYDSVDVWNDPDLFMLDQEYNPVDVAGVPPDYFSKTGQLWGNPLYNYEKMKQDNYAWWVNRVRYSLKQTDYVRIDHFRGFSAYYAIPFGEETAINGKWVKGPGMDLFNVINSELNNPKIIAENLGLLDDDVNQLIKDTTYPGMKILEFEVYSQESINELKQLDANNILYPGTHDNNTFIGWYKENSSEEERRLILKEFKLKENEGLTEGLIRYCYNSQFDYVIMLLQDVLGYDSNTRYNYPGKGSGNWQYMFKEEDFDSLTAKKLARYKEKYVK